MLMISVPVATPSRSYEVLIGSGLLTRAGECLGKILENRRAFVVTVPPVRRRWAKVLLKSLAASGIETGLIEMPDGERSKRLATLEKLAGKLVRQGADRGVTLIALGGGVVGDVTGFLASIYMRGVDVIQLPTTVLAQVDAAIGGKTGVNLPEGKNLVGAFFSPVSVITDPAFLESLPDAQFRSGLYEIVKYGVIGDARLFAFLESNMTKILRRDAGALAWLVVGYAHVLDKDYAKAIDPLNRAKVHAGDLGDYVAYYLGSSYLQTGRTAANPRDDFAQIARAILE